MLRPTEARSGSNSAFIAAMDDIRDNTNEVLTVADVARVLRCSKAHVCKIINGQGKGAAPIPTIAFSRRK